MKTSSKSTAESVAFALDHFSFDTALVRRTMHGCIPVSQLPSADQTAGPLQAVQCPRILSLPSVVFHSLAGRKAAAAGYIYAGLVAH